MRRALFSLLPAAFTLCLCAPSIAHAEDNSPLQVNVAIESRYIDTEVFHTVNSNAPSIQIEATYNITDQIYVSGYAYTGFKQPFADASSEYGYEIGDVLPISDDASVTLAAGRYADYQGRGFSHGDLYAKAAVTYGRANASVSVLAGDANTLLMDVSYSLPVGDHLTVTPSIVYLTRGEEVRPALTVSYELSDSLTLMGKVVMPEDVDTRKRTVFAAVELSFKF